MATCCYHSFSHWLTVCFQSDRAHYLFVPHNSSLKQVLLCPFHRPRSWSSKDLNDFFQTKERFHCIPRGSRQLVYPFTLGSHITSLNLRKPVSCKAGALLSTSGCEDYMRQRTPTSAYLWYLCHKRHFSFPSSANWEEKFTICQKAPILGLDSLQFPAHTALHP